MRVGLRAAVLIAVACIAGCGGGGGGGSSTPPPTFTVGGTVSGLSGSGLILQLNGAGNLGVSGNGFTFGGGLTSGSNYSVTVFSQPTNPSQTCAVTSGTGTIGTTSVTNVAVSCTTNSFTVGGNVSGLLGSGLVLQNNGGNNLTINANGLLTFTTPILSGATYAVTVLTQPTAPTQACLVENGSGTVGAGNVTNVSVTCNSTFTIGSLSDPLAAQQWHLKNIGQNAFADGVGVTGIDINVEPVYSTLGLVGNGVIAAVVDTGLEIAHEDLAANVVPGGSWDFNNSDTDPTSTATTGDHGTEVGGLIAMARNGVGGVGVAPKAQLKGFNFLSSTQTLTQHLDSLGGSTANPNSSNVFIFNQSFGISPIVDSPINTTVQAQYVTGVNQLRGGRGALYVKAAGNGFIDMHVTNNANCDRPFGPILAGVSCENANFDHDNTIPYQIIVGAVNADGIKASYSTAGSPIWVSAPGGEFGLNASVAPGLPAIDYEPAMVTTDQSGCVIGSSTTNRNNGSTFNNGGAPNAQCNYTNEMNGTSSATPITSGVIALILEANPALTWRDVKHILARTARQVDAARAAVNITGLTGGSYQAEPAWTTNHATPQAFKFHNWYGFGMVDASAAVNMARTYDLNTLGTFVDTGFISSPTLSLSIPDNTLAGVSSTINVPNAPVNTVEAVQISVTATHTYTGDLAIELTSPSLTRSVLKTGDDGFVGPNLNGMVLLSNAFYGEPAAGNWTIKVVDVAPGDVGILTNWKIRVFGH